jgi:peptidoglycan hydrolase-like protein with peptidoglycan-binding domain
MASTAEMRAAWGPEGRAGPQLEKVVFTSSGDGAVASVDARCADAFRALDAVLAAHGYPTRKADTGGYVLRKIRGGDGWSLHSYGICVDVNWQSNPYVKRAAPWGGGFGAAAGIPPGTVTDLTPEIVRDVLAIRTRGGAGVFRWGGQYGTYGDAMHWEVVVGPSELATGIDGAAPKVAEPWTAPTKQPTGQPSLRAGGGPKGAVEELQRLLVAAGFDTKGVDGVFGKGTDAAVRAFQASRQLDVDGVVGTRTWAALMLQLPAVGDHEQRPFRGADGDRASAPVPDPGSMPTVRRGNTGEGVRLLQAELNADGAALEEDGVFGPGTEAVVRSWQGAHGLAADGVVGPKTWRALLAV